MESGPIVRLATAADSNWLADEDHHIDAAWVARCITAGQYFVALENGVGVGFLRFSWFWRSIPYMELIRVSEVQRRSGVGTALFAAWEAAMIAAGARLLMTSSMLDEPEPQAWHRRNGFREAGSLTFGAVQPEAEIFFVKDL